MNYSSSTAGAQSDSSRLAAISVRGLSKQFTTQTVLADVSFDIVENELLVILGPSGSGKTTILRIIAGLEAPDAGDIYLTGRRVTTLPPQARGLGVVFQEQALFLKMSVEENIAFGLKLRRVAKDRIVRTVADMLELTRLYQTAKNKENSCHHALCDGHCFYIEFHDVPPFISLYACMVGYHIDSFYFSDDFHLRFRACRDAMHEEVHERAHQQK